jgi:uncharacterized membrane protein YheB (UPF0754 family)
LREFLGKHNEYLVIVLQGIANDNHTDTRSKLLNDEIRAGIANILREYLNKIILHFMLELLFHYITRSGILSLSTDEYFTSLSASLRESISGKYTVGSKNPIGYLLADAFAWNFTNVISEKLFSSISDVYSREVTTLTLLIQETIFKLFAKDPLLTEVSKLIESHIDNIIFRLEFKVAITSSINTLAFKIIRKIIKSITGSEIALDDDSVKLF